MTLVSVVIPTKDRPGPVVEAVRSILEGTYQEFELFVVDQSKDTATRDALAQFSADRRLHYVKNNRPGRGASISRNIGIALSNGQLIANTDDDVTATPGWLANIVSEFETDPDLQLVCGKLTAPPFDANQGFIPSFEPAKPLSNWQMPIYAAGANLSMRRSLFDKVGGYDEFFGPGGSIGASDDGDLTHRIMRSGAKWKVCPHIEVIHTNGFRTTEQGVALLKGYIYGLGSTMGRYTRRGDILALLWFLQYQLKVLLTVVVPKTLKRRHPNGFGWFRDRFIGFWLGFKQPPYNGFVKGADLRHLRQELLDSANLPGDQQTLTTTESSVKN